MRFRPITLWLLLAFAVSRVLYFAAGIRFQTNRLASDIQFLDLALLRTRLWETLYYCHSQPPLMNAIVGLFVKLSPEHYGILMHAFYIVLGALSTLLLYQLMRYLNVGERVAGILTIAFIASPGCVLFENYPLYEYEMMFLLLLSSVLFYKLVTQPSAKLSLFFFSTLAALAWIRSLYHLYVLLLIAGAVCVFLWKDRYKVLAGAALPILSVAALYFKNLLVFGFFGCSSWLGPNMIVISAHQLNPAEKAELVRQGAVSELVNIDPGDNPDKYGRFLPAPVAPTGIPILDENVKQVGGGPNVNNLIYLKLDPVFGALGKTVLRLKPKTYLQSLAIAIFCYALPPTDFFHFEQAREALWPFERAMNIVVYGQFLETTRAGLREILASGEGATLPFYTGSFLLVIIPVLLGWGGWLTWQSVRGHALSRAQVGLLVYLLFSILFIFATTTLLSSFENNRYRFPTDPLYVILWATLLTRLLQRRKVRVSTPPALAAYRDYGS